MPMIRSAFAIERCVMDVDLTSRHAGSSVCVASSLRCSVARTPVQAISSSDRTSSGPFFFFFTRFDASIREVGGVVSEVGSCLSVEHCLEARARTRYKQTRRHAHLHTQIFNCLCKGRCPLARCDCDCDCDFDFEITISHWSCFLARNAKAEKRRSAGWW